MDINTSRLYTLMTPIRVLWQFSRRLLDASPIVFGICLIALVSGTTAAVRIGLASQSTSTNCYSGLGCFVYASHADDSLYLNGNKLRLFGSSTYPIGVSWSSPPVNGQPAPIVTYLQQNMQVAKSAGMNFLRITDFMGNNPWNPQVWNNLQTVAADAQQQGIFLSVDLTGFERYECASGGSAGQGTWAYTPSLWQSFFSNPNVNLARFDKYTSIVDFEIDGLGDLNYLGQPDGACTLTTSNISAIPTFYNSVGAILHGSAFLPHHLVDTGGLSHINSPSYGIPWRQIYAEPNIDMIGTETYSQSDIQNAVQNLIPWAVANHKPFTNEFGFSQGSAACTSASALPAQFSSPGFNDQCRSYYYNDVYSAVNGASANTNIDFWNLGNLAGAGHYDAWPSATPLVWTVITRFAHAFTSVNPTPPPTPTPTLQNGCLQGFSCSNVGAEGNSSISVSGSTVTVHSVGLETYNVAGAPNAYHMVAKQMTGDFEVTAELTAQSNQGDCKVPLNYSAVPSCPVVDQIAGPAKWGPQAGLIIRASTAASDYTYGIFQFPEDNPEVGLGACQALPQLRVLATDAPAGGQRLNQYNRYCGTPLPQYLRIERQGDLLWAEHSLDGGQTWTFLDGSFQRMPQLSGTVYAGIAMNSATAYPGGSQGSASFANFTIDPFATYAPGVASTGCPSGWACADIGGPGPAGGQSYAGGTLTLHGSGAGSNDIGGSINKMHYVWQDSGSGDGQISARLAGIYVPNANGTPTAYPESGLLVQSSNNPGNDTAAPYEAENPFYAVVAQNPSTLGNLSHVNVRAVSRATMDGTATTSSSVALTLPFWMRIVRSGDTFSAYTSSDGTTWALLPGSTATIAGFSVGERIGLAGTGQLRGNTTVTFTNISVTGMTQPPSSPLPPVAPPPPSPPTPVPPSPSGLSVTNLAVFDQANRSLWSIQQNFAVGSMQYGDRDYTLADIPSALKGAAWIQTANASKTSGANPLTTFTIDRAATVYIALDVRVRPMSWLSSEGWAKTSLSLRDSDPQSHGFDVYSKSFPAGTVTIGPENVAANGHSMYTVAVQ